MKKIACLLVCLFSGAANATLLETDLVSSGDGLLFLDTATNREWVDVAKTTNMSVNQFFTGSIYSGKGFHLADQAALNQLYVDAGATDIALDDTITFTAGNYAAAQLLAGLMEHASPFTQTSGNSWIHGYMDFGNPTFLTLSRFNAFGSGNTGSFGINTNGTGWTYDTQHAAIGIWAYRDLGSALVPEPAPIAMLLTGLLGGLYWRRKPGK